MSSNRVSWISIKISPIIAAEISRYTYPDVNAASREFPSLGTGSRLCSCSHWSPRLDSRVSVATIIGSREPRGRAHATRMQLHSLHSSVKRRTHPCRAFMTLIRWIDVKACISFSQRFSKCMEQSKNLFSGQSKESSYWVLSYIRDIEQCWSIILVLYSRWWRAYWSLPSI